MTASARARWLAALALTLAGAAVAFCIAHFEISLVLTQKRSRVLELLRQLIIGGSADVVVNRVAVGPGRL